LQKLQDSNYRDAMNLAEEYTNASPATLQALYDINKIAEAELAQYEDNTNLTDLQREIAVKRVELAQLEAQARALGQPVSATTTVAEAPPPFPDTTTVEAPPPPAPRSHTLRIGDTIGSIAAAYGLPVNVILNANPGLQVNGLRPGQQIILPPAPGAGR
jgi:LysM repeat protein